MPLIADICPHCRRVTRCQVFERATSDVAIKVMGVPIASMPISSAFLVCCGECGGEFKSRTWDERRALSPGDAMEMDLDQILTLTNPTLREEFVLRDLHSDPRLADAFTLLGKLKPGGVHKGLRTALLQWPTLDEGERDRFLTDARRCDAALGFAHAMACQSKPVAIGLLAGGLVGTAVGLGCFWVLGPDKGFWSGVAGFVSGMMTIGCIWSGRDRRWISDVLIPEADRKTIHLGWFLQVLQQGGFRKQGELQELCELAWVIESKLVAGGRVLEEPAFLAASAAKPA